MASTGARSWRAPRTDPLRTALQEIDVAIDLVCTGQARAVELAGLPAAERAAGLGVARAQAAGVRFALLRSGSRPGAVSLRIGPRLAEHGIDDA